jgi:A/G-specific adenine glycosylase
VDAELGGERIDRLLAWYDRHRRVLPWRALPGERADPYRVWLSEIMLQQTTVAAVIPYFERFVARFPTLESLAAAPEMAVLQHWAGLGYYARARNLHRCAGIVAAAGGFAKVADLRALPGVGVYTATAIGAIAFDRPGIPVDGNVERVVSRLAAITAALPGSKGAIAREVSVLAGDRAAQARPSDTAQALFDLGATLCVKAAPACVLCPLRGDCLGFARGIAASLPAKVARAVRPVRHGAAFYLEDAQGQVLLRRRPAEGLLGGMSELPGTSWRAAPWPQAEAMGLAPTAADWRAAGQVRHVFTHFELRLDVYAARVGGFDSTERESALPSIMRKCLALGQAALGRR